MCSQLGRKLLESTLSNLVSQGREEDPRCVQSQGGGTPTRSVLQAATAVKIKVNSQLEIFSLYLVINWILL